VTKVLDVSKTEIRRNSEWFDQFAFQDFLKLAGRMTVARMIERDTFQERMKASEPIGIHEMIYPLMQGWDSVMIRCDLELGGTDQLFNLLRGRDLQREEGQEGQVCFTTPLINGFDGRKMSKSYGNAVLLTDSATGNKPVGIGIQFSGNESVNVQQKIETHLAGAMQSDRPTCTM
jgi:tyrosyl-tRNA synthetase